MPGIRKIVKNVIKCKSTIFVVNTMQRKTIVYKKCEVPEKSAFFLIIH
nr:MAG TPA: hypothetical protein [Caudoviricetes sp.]